MKIRSLLSFYEEVEPPSYEEFLLDRIDSADSIENHNVWMDLYKFEFEKREETK